MERRAKRDRTGEPLEPSEPSPPLSPVPTCAACHADDPHIRARHQIELAKQGLDAMQAHLWQCYALKSAPGRRQELIDGITTWAGNLMTQYSGFADPETGAPMPWWIARQQTLAARDTIAHMAHERAPAGYSPRPGHVRTRAVPLVDREPGEDDPD